MKSAKADAKSTARVTCSGCGRDHAVSRAALEKKHPKYLWLCYACQAHRAPRDTEDIDGFSVYKGGK